MKPLALALFALASASAQSPNGSQLYARECAGCHSAADPGRAPSPNVLKTLAPQAVVTALTSGKMSVQGQRLSPAERNAIAEFVTGKAIGAATGASGAQCPESATTAASLEAALKQPGWNGWGNGLAATRFQPAAKAKLTAAQVPRLKLAWAFGFPNALAARTQPTVVGDWLFTASDTGDVYALNSRTGCTRWTYRAQAAVRTAMTVARLKPNQFAVYFGDGRANAYALDAVTGRQLWIRKVEEHPNATVTGAPSAYDGRLYVPVSAAGEEVRGQNPDYACCTFRGSVSALDMATGEVLWKTYSIREAPAPIGKSSKGVQLYGPSGAGIWGSPTIDAKRGMLYVGTGNGYSEPEQPTMNAILAMDLLTGAIRWSRQTVPRDVWLYQCDGGKKSNPNCPEENGPDFDYGAAPAIARLNTGKELLIVPQKSAVLYALDPDRRGTIVWEYRAGQGSALGGLWGVATDGERAYLGVGDTLSPNPGGMHAVNLLTGGRAWFTPAQPKLCKGGPAERCFAAQGGAITAIPGVVFNAGADGGLRAYAAKDGKVLWTFDTNRDFETVNGVPAKGATMDAAGPVVVNGMVYVNSGYNGIVGRAGNVLLAFRAE